MYQIKSLLYKTLFYLGITSLVACHSNYYGVVYNHHGPLNYKYVDSVRDFSISFDSKDNINDRKASRKFKKYNFLSTPIKTLPDETSILYVKKDKDYSYLDFSTGILYKDIEVADFLLQYETALKSNINISTFGTSTELELAPNLTALTPKVFTYTFANHKINQKAIEVILALEKKSEIYRLVYILNNQQDFLSAWDSGISQEVASFKADLNRKNLDTFNQSPLLFAINNFKESKANYLVPITELNKFASETIQKPNLQWSWLYSKALFYSFCGDILNSRKSERLMSKGEDLPFDTIKHVKLYPVIEKIGSIARANQVIMLNESHLDPYCRVFAASLLDTLYKHNYKYIFIETLTDDSLLNDRKYPIQTSGVYTSEPMFGNFVRKALGLGFIVHPYECVNDCDTEEDRDLAQAKNIAKVLSSDKHAKALVYAGHGHIYKSNATSTAKRMASNFQNITGINPFCIDQTAANEIQFQGSNYSYFTNKNEFYQPSVLIDSATSDYLISNDMKGMIDAMVVHPRTIYYKGRYANWLLRQGNYETKVKLKGEKYDGTLLTISIQRESEGIEPGVNIPVLALPLSEKNNLSIYLAKGEYFLAVNDAQRNLIYSKKLKLK